VANVLAKHEHKMDWQKLKDLTGFGGADIAGVYGKYFGDKEEGPWFYIIKHDPGALVEKHTHNGNVIHYILEGNWYMGKNRIECIPGWFHYEKKGLSYGPIQAGENGVTFLTIYDAAPDFIPKS
jgi:hypothetical protein